MRACPLRFASGPAGYPCSPGLGPGAAWAGGWVGEDPADRYQLVTSVGAFLCEVRAGQAYLVGVYD